MGQCWRDPAQYTERFIARVHVSKFRNINFGQIFYAADNLGGSEYDPRTLMLGTEITDEKRKIISLAFECGLAIDKTI